MPRPCSVCSRLDRAALDVELARPQCNVAAFCRDHGLKETSVKRHRAEHLPTFLRIYGLSADLPKLGELHGELLRLYSSALDNLAKAEAGVLIEVAEGGREHRLVSHTAVARAISEARKTLDSISRLAADAADENERPMGLADGALTERIRTQLERVVSQATSNQVATSDPQPQVEGERAPSAGALAAPGGLSGSRGAPSPSQIPLDAGKAVSTAQGNHQLEVDPRRQGNPGALSPTVKQVIAASERTVEQATPSSDAPVITIPNPRYPGSPAASSEERRAAGYPDITLTVDDLRARPDLLAQLATEPLPPQTARPES